MQFLVIKAITPAKALTTCLALAVILTPRHALAQSSFGQQIPLNGQINELALDEARGLVYAGNFSAGRVDVIQIGSNQCIASFPTTPTSAATTGMAMSTDGQYLITTNFPVTFGVTQLASITLINLNDPSDRGSYAIEDLPLGVAFGIDGRALIVTSNNLQLFDPESGAFTLLFDFETAAGEANLPGIPPSFPRQISFADLTSSRDGRWIFGVTQDLTFSYEVQQPTGLLTLRPNDTLVNVPSFPQVSAGRDGRYFMNGPLLMDRRLRVIADTPEAPSPNVDLIGGTGIDSNINTVYAAFDDPSTQAQPGEEGATVNPHPTFGALLVMDADNLYVRNRLRLSERIVGEIAPGGNGRYLYAVSESGLLYLPIGDMGGLPQLSVNPQDRDLLFQFDFCQKSPVTRTMRFETPPGAAPARFSLSVEPFRSSGRPAILFEPHTGVTPIDVQVTVDPGALGPVQGTNLMPVIIDSDAVNITTGVQVISNIRDVDQQGTFYQVPGHLTGVVGDTHRDRFYVLDETRFEVLAYDSISMRQIGSFRTGNSPTWMTMSHDGRYLVIANSRGENLSLIDLDRMQEFGKVYAAWQLLLDGHYPISVSKDAANILIGARNSSGSTQLDTLQLPSQQISTRQTLGIFTNQFGNDIAVVGAPDGTSAMIVDSSGTTALWESSSNRLVAARSDFIGAISGAVGAGPNYFVAGSHVMNRSLVPIGDFPDGTAIQESSGFALQPDGTGVRTIRPRFATDTGAIQTLDSRQPTRILNPTRMVEPPPSPSANTSFTQTLASLRDGRLISTSSAGIIEFPADYASRVSVPHVSSITNGADFRRTVGPGGLVSIFGERLADGSAQASGTPLPAKLAGSCVSVNGGALPLLFASPTQINAQMPFLVGGSADVQVHTPGGTSSIFVQSVSPAAPAIFSVMGPDGTRYAAVFRAENNQFSTLTNPLRPNETAVIYLTGLGNVTPAALPGVPASSTVLSQTLDTPIVEVGGVQATVHFAGLTPGFVGLYQINVQLHGATPLGLQVPLTVTMAGNQAATDVRVID